MKRFLYTHLLLMSFLFVVAASLSAHPDDRNTFFVYLNSSDTPKAFSLDDLDKITFTDSGMQLWEANGTTEIDFSTFNFLSLDEEITPMTAVKNLSVGKDLKIQYRKAGDVVVVEGNEPLSGVSIYDLQGRLVAADPKAAKSYRVSVAKVPRGVFFVKVAAGGKVTSQKLVK